MTEVAGRPIGKPFNIEFTVPALANVKLARDPFQLYELKTGNKIGRLDSNQIAELEKGYVGNEMRLAAYETGGYSGIPRDLPQDVPSWQDHSFAFSTSLVLLAERP